MKRRLCSDIMTREVLTIDADKSIYEAACMMKDNDIGALPVVENNELVGILTDRDIVVRAVAAGMDMRTSVREIMTKEVFSMYEDDFVFNAIREMGQKQIRRVPILDRNERLVGIISMADIALEAEDQLEVAEVLEDISSGRSFWRKF
ncbi:MAG: CBS domain-containing protein [Pyrinomonadaceae bacterium]|nr:CBS domain-containing protein [Pyrinomonadaceae bacterium]MCX7639947.1 CBS domain-containing protein [Pyrinomonadaceae bacterium]MDW8304119.1 CBS domain-containing protein [Acidobacteriota bacterium]